MKLRRSRRGVAMLAALWLVVGITVVALEFSLIGQERRQFGLAAADRAHGAAFALGAFAMTQAKLEYVLRNGPQNATGGLSQARAADPWLGADSTYTGPMTIDSSLVNVEVVDLGARLNINTLSEGEWRTFFTYMLNDAVVADMLAQSIVDWRDVDDIARPKGGERDDYIKAGLLRLPANQNFRDLEDLLDVKGMTPQIFALVSPYLTTLNVAQVNLNSAPVPVLRVLPGMTDEILARIISMRSRGARIASVAQVMPPARGGVGPAVAAAQAAQNARTQQALGARAGVLTSQLQVTFYAQASNAAKPVRLRVMMQRSNINGAPAATVASEEWR